MSDQSDQGDAPRTYLSESTDSKGSGEKRVRFVSRSGRAAGQVDPVRSSETRDAPRLGAPAMWLLLLVTLALQIYSWNRLEGYQLADSVESMERAHAFVTGQELPAAGGVRSFGFSIFLVPIFAVAEWLELDDLSPAVNAVRILQMLLGLGLVFFCTRIGARLGGRQVGYAAGFLCAVNPVFLQYTVDPVSGMAAAFFIAVGLDCLLERGSFRSSLVGGLALGWAFLMAYQTIAISIPLLALVFLRDRFKHSAGWRGAGLGFAMGIGAQVVLDRVSYGTWGVSIGNYLIENVGGVTCTILIRLGFEDTQLVHDLYEATVTHMGGAIETVGGEPPSPVLPAAYYLPGMPRMVVWPVLALGLLGLAQCWLRLSWKCTILVLLFGLNTFLLSNKGAKSFRLWLPLIPMIVPICAWGWGALRGVTRERPGAWRAVVGALAMASALVLGVQALGVINTRRFGAYWDALEFVKRAIGEERTRCEAEGREWEPQRVSAAYDWTVFGRGNGDLQLAKFTERLSLWGHQTESQRAQTLHEVANTHWVILHAPVFLQSETLTRAFNENYELAASFHDEDTAPGLRDVRVLRNIAEEGSRECSWAGRRPRRMWEVIENADPEAYRLEHELDLRLPGAASFVAPGEDGRLERLLLLGWDFEELPGSKLGWITYHWFTDTGFDHDYMLVDRISIHEGARSWSNDHTPGFGWFPTTRWPPGSIVREGQLVVPAHDPFGEGFAPLGGAFRRGDLLPASLWVKGTRFDDKNRGHDLMPALPGAERPLDVGFDNRPNPLLRSPEGHRLSIDGLLLVGHLEIRVQRRYRWLDDGRPNPE